MTSFKPESRDVSFSLKLTCRLMSFAVTYGIKLAAEGDTKLTHCNHSGVGTRSGSAIFVVLDPQYVVLVLTF
jgi:hypothetical protein